MRVTHSDARPSSRRAHRERALTDEADAGVDQADAGVDEPDAGVDEADAGVDEAPVDLDATGRPAVADDADATDATDATDAVLAQLTGIAQPGRRVALAWVDEDAIAGRSAPGDLRAASSSYIAVSPDLLAHRPRRSPLRAGIVFPVLAVLALVGAYAGATLLWPLNAVPPVVQTAAVDAVTSPASAVTWPEEGSAAVGVAGISATPASTDEADSIASITKLVTVLMVLEQEPLAVGESGPTYTMTYSDRLTYLNYTYRGESALAVRTGTELTMLELIQGTLIGSAGNYADYLASLYWPTDAVFASAAADWLDRHDLDGITIIDPTGIGRGNTATPEALITLARKALQNAVVADVVKTQSVELPTAGTVENTNELLSDDGVIGLKTGSLTGHYNLLAAQEIAVGDTTVRLYATVIGQPTSALRTSETARLLDEVAAEVAAPAVLPGGTVVGTVTTPWGERADIVTDADAQVVLWNGATAAPVADLQLGDARDADDAVGTLTLTGPLDEATVGVHLAAGIPDPDPWWRLTHPLELFGLTD